MKAKDLGLFIETNSHRYPNPIVTIHSKDWGLDSELLHSDNLPLMEEIREGIKKIIRDNGIGDVALESVKLIWDVM